MTATERAQVDRLILELTRRGAGSDAVIRLTYGLPPRAHVVPPCAALPPVPSVTGRNDQRQAAQGAIMGTTNEQGDAA